MNISKIRARIAELAAEREERENANEYPPPPWRPEEDARELESLGAGENVP